jgi:hypothetical protein
VRVTGSALTPAELSEAELEVVLGLEMLGHADDEGTNPIAQDVDPVQVEAAEAVAHLTTSEARFARARLRAANDQLMQTWFERPTELGRAIEGVHAAAAYARQVAQRHGPVPLRHRRILGAHRRPGVRRCSRRTSRAGPDGDPESDEPAEGRLELLGGRDRQLTGSMARLGVVTWT